MDIWDKILKAFAAAGGAVVGMLGGWTPLMTVLAAAMVLDYISGVIVAIVGRSPKTEGGHLDSKVGYIGLAKKGLVVIVVLLATLLDAAVGNSTMVFQTAAACYYIANEGISILENAALLGLPVPEMIERTLEQLKKAEADEDKNKGKNNNEYNN